MLQKYSVKKPMTVVVAVIAVIILGVISFMNMTTDLLPSMDLPYVVVYTTYPGASPEKIEQTVTKPLEQTLATTSGIKKVQSISSENVSMIILEFNQGTNMDSAMIEMSGSMDLVKGFFDDMVGSPTLMKINPDMLPVAISSIDFDGMEASELADFTEATVIPALEKIEGVASVNASGMLEKQLTITLNEEKIGAINEKIVKSLEETFDEAQEKLDKAQKQISSAQRTLAAEKKKAAGQIKQGAEQIDAGIAQIDQALAMLPSQREELVNAKHSMEGDKAALEALLEQRLEQEAAGTADPEGMTSAELSARINQCALAIAGYEQAIAGLDAQGEVLEAQRAELVASKQQLDDGKKELAEKTAEAGRKLNSVSKDLADKQEEFNDTREQAIESAGIDRFITADMIKGILSADNFSMPAGYVQSGSGEKLVKVGDTFVSAGEMESLELADIDVEGVGVITLADVADVEFTDNSKEIFAKINGNDGIILSVQKQSTASTVEVSHRIAEAVKQLEAEHEGLHITSLNDQGTYIDIIIASVLENLLLGGLLAVLILLIFLRDVKPTAVIALSIPISLMFAVVLMYFTDVTLNIISLSGLALGVGMLVDNSIVVIENIYRMRSEGKSAKEAAVSGATQVAGAIFASTLTTVCVFLPIVFTQGLSRQLFVDMGLTIAYSLMASLVVALTVVPALAAPVLKTQRNKEHKLFDAFVRGYGRLLSGALKVKPVVILVAVGLLGFSAWGAFNMGTAFLPDSDTPQISATVTMDEDATTEELREMAMKAGSIIEEIDGVQTVGITEGAGLSALGGSSGNSVSLYVILSQERTMSSAEICGQIAERTKELDCEVAASGSGMNNLSMLTGSGITAIVYGSDLDEMSKTAREVAALLEQTEGTKEVSDGIQTGKPELRVSIDKNKALGNGLTVAQVYSMLSGALAESSKTTTVTIDSADYPVVVIDGTAESVTPENLSDFVVGTKKNEDDDSDEEEEELTLGEIAEITESESLESIHRTNQRRYMTVSCEIAQGYNIGLVSRDFEQKLSSLELPKGITVELEGENEAINETIGDLLLMVALAIVLIYLIMVAQFQSLLSPFIVIFTIPLAFTGGLLALMITGMEISVISMLGFLVLSGIIVNNGIVFVDYVNKLREEGMAMREAVILAGKTRIRPILMTAITTILGLSTLALGLGQGADLVQPLAVVTIGGLIYATLMTLFVVPCLYELFHRRGRKPALNAPEKTEVEADGE